VFQTSSWDLFKNKKNIPFVCNGWRRCKEEKKRQLDVDCYAGIEIVTYAAGKSPPHLLQFAVNIVPPSKGMVSNN
jgi:hypothetical protein